jgi:hypothetical protein
LKVFALNRAILAAWPWGNNLGAVLLGDGMVVNALRNEIYRVSGRPPATGGMPGDPRGPSYPGGVAEDIMWAMMPERIKPIVEKFAAASASASVIMKTGRNSPASEMNGAAHSPASGDASPPVEQPAMPSSPNQPQAASKLNPEMLALLEKQNALVSGPWNDAVDAQHEEISRRLKELAEVEGAAQ